MVSPRSCKCAGTQQHGVLSCTLVFGATLTQRDVMTVSCTVCTVVAKVSNSGGAPNGRFRLLMRECCTVAWRVKEDRVPVAARHAALSHMRWISLSLTRIPDSSRLLGPSASKAALNALHGSHSGCPAIVHRYGVSHAFGGPSHRYFECQSSRA